MSTDRRLSQNQITADPSLRDTLDILKKEIFLSLNCHAIGTVQAFDETDQTASISINYQKTFFQLDSKTQNYVPVLVPYPVLIDCPVICMGGASNFLTFPIQQGDTCLVLFNDRDIDNWFQGGVTTDGVASQRMHSISDAIALVGLRSSHGAISDYDTTRVRLQNGNAYVGVGNTLIKIANNSTTLKTLLQDLITQIKAIAVSPGTFAAGATPVTGAGAVSAASQTALTTISTSIAGLLE